MNEQTTTAAQVPIDHVAIACAIATGAAIADPDAAGFRIRGGYKNLNARGNGPWWYRMVYRGGSWTYFSDERLPMGTFRASDRCASVYGTVYAGELLAQHDKGGKVDGVQLVRADPADPADPYSLEGVEFSRGQDGSLSLTLPDGGKIVVPDPRK